MVLSLLQLTFVITLVAHWMCCFWFYIGYVPDGWVVRNGLAEVEEGEDGTSRLMPNSALPSYLAPGTLPGSAYTLWSNGHVYEWISR